MQFDWRVFLGPTLTALVALSTLATDRLAPVVPDPAPLFICIVALAGSLAGLGSAFASVVVAVASTALLSWNHASGDGPPAFVQMAMFGFAALGTAGITGGLRKRLVDTLAWERRHHATAERLSAALDQVDLGIVLLDADTRAEFINRAFRDYFALPDEKADSKPPFIALMYHARDTGAWELPEEELSAFIARRTEMMRVGDQTPINVNLRNGEVLRFSCTALPDGGRMLSYTPVTDLVRHTDDPAQAEQLRSLRGKRPGVSYSHLSAAE